MNRCKKHDKIGTKKCDKLYKKGGDIWLCIDLQWKDFTFGKKKIIENH